MVTIQIAGPLLEASLFLLGGEGRPGMPGARMSVTPV
jgi:hypothetical protein